jgi:hypothetical protein
LEHPVPATIPPPVQPSTTPIPVGVPVGPDHQQFIAVSRAPYDMERVMKIERRLDQVEKKLDQVIWQIGGLKSSESSAPQPN